MNALKPELRGLGLKRQNTRSSGAVLRRGETHLFVTALQTLHYGWTQPDAARVLRDTACAHLQVPQTAEPVT